MARSLDEVFLCVIDAVDRCHAKWKNELLGTPAAASTGVVAPEEGRAPHQWQQAHADQLGSRASMASPSQIAAQRQRLVETIIELPVKGPPPVVVPTPNCFKRRCKPPPTRFVPLPKSPSWMVPASKQPPPPRRPPPPLVQGERKAPPQPALLLASKLEGPASKKPPPPRPPPPRPPGQWERKAPAQEQNQQPTTPPPAPLLVVSKLEGPASKKPPPPPRGDHPRHVIPGPSAGASLAAGGPRGDHPRDSIPGPSAGNPLPPPGQGERKEEEPARGVVTRPPPEPSGQVSTN